MGQMKRWLTFAPAIFKPHFIKSVSDTSVKDFEAQLTWTVEYTNYIYAQG